MRRNRKKKKKGKPMTERKWKYGRCGIFFHADASNSEKCLWNWCQSAQQCPGHAKKVSINNFLFVSWATLNDEQFFQLIDIARNFAAKILSRNSQNHKSQGYMAIKIHNTNNNKTVRHDGRRRRRRRRAWNPLVYDHLRRQLV